MLRNSIEGARKRIAFAAGRTIGYREYKLPGVSGGTSLLPTKAGSKKLDARGSVGNI